MAKKVKKIHTYEFIDTTRCGLNAFSFSISTSPLLHEVTCINCLKSVRAEAEEDIRLSIKQIEEIDKMIRREVEAKRNGNSL